MAAEQRAHRRRLLGRRQRVEQDVQREQRQAEADGDAAERPGQAAAADAEGHEADDEQHRRDRRDVEGQQLHDQRRADIGAEHDGERRHQADQAVGGERCGHQPGRGAALQQRGQAKPGGESGEAIAQRLAEEAAQVGAERAQHAAQDHVQAPQQQRHAAHQIEQDDRSHRVTKLRNVSSGIGTMRRRTICACMPIDEWTQPCSVVSAAAAKNYWPASRP